jgi:homoserine O-acetyltransferase
LNHLIAGRSSLPEVLGSIAQPVLVVGIDSDTLYPLAEQQLLHRHIPNSTLGVIRSPAGHDGFLLEGEQLSSFIVPFLHRYAVLSKL